MALWGNADGKTATGTAAISSVGAVTGSGTAFTTEAKVGDYLRIAGEDYKLTAIASDTAATVVAGVPGATLTAVGVAASYTLSEKCGFVTDAESSGSSSGKHGDPTKVFGADTTETGVTAGITHSGWVRRTVGSGGRSGRVHFEVLVAGGTITGDQADDTELPDS